MGAARFTLIDDWCVRIEWAADDRFVDEPSMFASRRTAASAAGTSRIVADSAGEVQTLETRGLWLEYRPDGRGLSGDNLRVIVKRPDGSAHGNWSAGLLDSRNLGGTLATLDGLRGPPTEPFPSGLLSRAGWSLVDDSAGHLLVDGWVVCRSWRGYQQEGRIDWFFFAFGEDYRRAFESLARVSGPVPMPRRCSLGSWFSRYWPYSSSEYRALVAEYDRHGFPLDVMVLDMDWHSSAAKERWTGWSWNRELVPDAERLLAWMHERGLRVTLNLHPAEGVGSWEDRYEAFMRSMGADPSTGERVEFDAGNRRYMESLFAEVLGPLERGSGTNGERVPNGGVDFWWLDWQQEPHVRSVPGLTNLAWLNRLFHEHTARARATTGTVAAGPTLRGQSFSRWGGWGDHRHPVHFSGDAHTGWEMLRFQVPFTATAGNVGCFFWSHDIGGHFGPRREEAAARWVQFGAMSAALRLHSARVEVLDRRPWTCEERFRESMRGAFALRSRLMPQIYSETAGGCAETLPLVRPMYLGWSGVERAYTCPGQYMLGNDVLVAPIVEPGIGRGCIATACVWFPPGAAWSRLQNGERYGSGSSHQLEGTDAVIGATIDEMPVFIRAGAPIFMQPFTTRMCSGVGVNPEQPDEQVLIIRLVPGPAGEEFVRTLYEDDGETSGHEHGACARTRVRAAWSAAECGTADDAVVLDLLIDGAVGSFAGQPRRRRLVVEIGGVRSITDARIDEAPCAATARTYPFEQAPVFRLETVRGVDEPLRVRLRCETQNSAAHNAACRSARAKTTAADGTHGLFMPKDADSPPDQSSVEFQEDYARVLAIASGVGVRMLDPGPCAGAGVASRRAVLIMPAELPLEPLARVQVLECVGPVERMVCERLVELAQSGSTVIDQLAPPLDEPAIGRRARRVVRVALGVRASGDRSSAEMVFAQEIDRRERSIRSWRVAGPFDWDWRRPIGEQRHGPETEPLEPSGGWHGQDHRRVGWSTGLSSPRWACDLGRMFAGRRGLAYAKATVVSTRRQPARFRFEAADKLEAWVNGARVFSQDGHWTPEAAASVCDAELVEGLNEVLVKCPDGWNDWGFSLWAECGHALAELAEPGAGCMNSPPMAG